MNPINSINQLCIESHANAVIHGFWEGALRCNIGEKVALIHSEISEFWEGERRGESPFPDEHCPEHPHGAIELADVLIRIFDLAGHERYDLGAAVQAKMAYNKTRPHLHGKKC